MFVSGSRMKISKNFGTIIIIGYYYWYTDESGFTRSIHEKHIYVVRNVVSALHKLAAVRQGDN